MTVSAGRLELETPDHVVLRYDLAGVGNRGYAALLDMVVALVASLAIVYLSSRVRLPFAGGGLVSLLVVGAVFAYFVLLEWLWNGQTIGKRAFGLRVITTDGSPAPFSACFIRNLVRFADFLPGVYGLGVVAIILSPRAQRLGDLAAGTYVVRAPRPRLDWLSLRTAAPPAAVTAGPALEVRSLPGEAQRLVREYVARERTLGPRDRERLAATLASRLRAYLPRASDVADRELILSVARALRETAESTPERSG